MKTKSCIALLLIIIFIGKLVALDSNFLGQAVNSDKLSFVKKSCELKTSQDFSDFEFVQDSDGIQVSFNSFCNSVYKLEKQELKETVVHPNFKNNFRFLFSKTNSFIDKFIPPPRLS